jgi:hypothetical protein
VRRKGIVQGVRIKDNDYSKVKQRRCLDCEKMFTSEWIGNRICYNCKRYNRGMRQGIDDAKIEEEYKY